jgi:uncharacterized UPF0160 family protein
VQEAYAKRFEVHPSGHVMVFEDATLWRDHLHEVEDGKSPQVLYVCGKFGDKDWRITAVAIREGSFISRKALPAEWRGLRGVDLIKQTAIDGAVFCHAQGFMGGCLTRQGVLAMAFEAMCIHPAAGGGGAIRASAAANAVTNTVAVSNSSGASVVCAGHNAFISL